VREQAQEGADRVKGHAQSTHATGLKEQRGQ
jgi:hypothetical protein